MLCLFMLLLIHEGNPLNNPMPTNLNIEEYKKWLDEGVTLFKSKDLK